MDIRPKEIKRLAGVLAIDWTNGEQTEIPSSAVRSNCACAVCKDMKTPLSSSQPYFQRAISLQNIKVVGNYALEIFWADGHRSIVPFTKLYELKNSPAENLLQTVEVDIDPRIMTKEKTCGCGKGGCGAKSQ